MKPTYHVGGHAVTDEEDDVLSLALSVQRTDNPLGSGGLAAVVVQLDLVLARLVEGKLAVDLGGDVDSRGLLGVLGVEVLEPVERPLLNLGVGDGESLCDILGGFAVLGDGDLEGLIRLAVVGSLRAVDGSVNLDTEIEELARQEVGLIRRQDAAEGRARTQTLVSLRRDCRKRGSQNGSRVDAHCG